MKLHPQFQQLETMQYRNIKLIMQDIGEICDSLELYTIKRTKWNI